MQNCLAKKNKYYFFSLWKKAPDFKCDKCMDLFFLNDIIFFNDKGNLSRLNLVFTDTSFCLEFSQRSEIYFVFYKCISLKFSEVSNTNGTIFYKYNK